MKQPSVETKEEPIYVMQKHEGFDGILPNKLEVKDIFITKSGMKILKSGQPVVVNNGAEMIRIMTAEDKIVITNEDTWK
jgi:hypothetical protein